MNNTNKDALAAFRARQANNPKYQAFMAAIEKRKAEIAANKAEKPNHEAVKPNNEAFAKLIERMKAVKEAANKESAE